MHLEWSDEQRAVMETTKAFVQRELMPHEDEVERTGRLDPELVRELRGRAIRAGLYAANMPEEVGGAGLDTLSWMLMERELGHTGYALQMLAVARPSRILLACDGPQRATYLLPTVAGERVECLAMTEPEAGSDLRGMRTRAVRDGADWVVTGTKHFISHADESDFVILFAATGDAAGRRRRAAPGGDHRLPGRHRRGRVDRADRLPQRLAPRLHQLGARLRRLPGAGLGGARRGGTRLRGGQHLARHHPAAGRRQLPGPGPAGAGAGRAARGHPQPVRPDDRPQPGRVVQARRHEHRAGVRVLADLARRLAGRRRPATADTAIAMAKLHATEALAMIADEALQIHGGMGLMDELVLERIWRDARVERIWDGTSEIQRHIVSRALLRAHGG